MKLAIIDYDGTLFKEETIPFLLKLAKESNIKRYDYYNTMFRMLVLLFRYKSGLEKSLGKEKFHVEAARKFLGIFRNMEKQEINGFFRNAAFEAEKHLNSEVVNEFKRLKSEGFFTVLLSGGFLPYITRVGEKLGFDQIIGTDISYGAKGFDLDREIVFITGKNKLKMILETFPESVDWENSYSFADSYFDSDILELAGISVAVNPDDKLRNYALQKGWRIIEKQR